MAGPIRYRLPGDRPRNHDRRRRKPDGKWNPPPLRPDDGPVRAYVPKVRFGTAFTTASIASVGALFIVVPAAAYLGSWPLFLFGTLGVWLLTFVGSYSQPSRRPTGALPSGQGIFALSIVAALAVFAWGLICFAGRDASAAAFGMMAVLAALPCGAVALWSRRQERQMTRIGFNPHARLNTDEVSD